MQEIDISDLRKLTEYIKTNGNYDFTNYAMSSFKRRVVRVLELYKLESVDHLIEKFRTEQTFMEVFLTEITVNVTEMFRDPSFWRHLRDDVVPNLLLNHKSINIWHAGCSSGEEVFSMAILLKEANLLDRVRIYATDLDHKIIAKAKKGRYTIKNMELNRKNYVRFQGSTEFDQYYKEENGFAVLDPSLIDQVTFRVHDLVQGPVFNKFDLVLCRNVMIYFNQNLQNVVLNKLHESLFNYGYLAVGSKESLIWCDIANKFIVVNNEEKIYKKIKE
ncbi:chemotaxis protein R [Persicobacter psychrovividus]|uniref:Chemotaxis protein R n=2 Tax=Persicobacter psychrovividus TaxID=387638 RepID=A0ABN6L9X1_9BACT|nr:chemotaxis protein R [Persicobacter psychrovividus]